MTIDRDIYGAKAGEDEDIVVTILVCPWKIIHGSAFPVLQGFTEKYTTTHYCKQHRTADYCSNKLAQYHTRAPHYGTLQHAQVECYSTKCCHVFKVQHTKHICHVYQIQQAHYDMQTLQSMTKEQLLLVRTHFHEYRFKIKILTKNILDRQLLSVGIF